jgi:hypothetical protein
MKTKFIFPFILFLILFIIIYLFYLFNKLCIENFNNLNEENNLFQPNRFFNIKTYKKLMDNNSNSKVLYKISLSDDVKIDEENCFEKCDRKNCIYLKERIKNLKDCLKCNLQEGKCFDKGIVDGSCNDCKDTDYKEKIDCLNTFNYGCPNPKDINLNEGVLPYFIEINSKDLNSPYNKKCIFCWDLQNLI